MEGSEEGIRVGRMGENVVERKGRGWARGQKQGVGGVECERCDC